MDLFELHDKVRLTLPCSSNNRLLVSTDREQTSRNLSSDSVVYVLKEIFASHGIPAIIISDNGPQFSAATFGQFALHYGFVHEW